MFALVIAAFFTGRFIRNLLLEIVAIICCCESRDVCGRVEQFDCAYGKAQVQAGKPQLWCLFVCFVCVL